MTTFVRQLDAQGPAVVQRITTHVGDLACSDDLVENLVEALHSGQSVTLTSNVNGETKSATFNADGTKLGYGEAYIAIALAAQQLRNAGVTGCASPEQWQAVLLGGPLEISSTTSSTNSFASASGSSTVPGIVTLHRQGQGWGKIAQSANLQLGQVISGSASASASAAGSGSASSGEESPSPTGFSSAEMNAGKVDRDDQDENKNDKPKDENKRRWQRDNQNLENKGDKDDRSNETKYNHDSSSSSSSPNR